MKKRILWLSLPLALGQASHAYAQDATDALRYSRLQFGGSARTLGIGGANVALGADYGNVSSNPAGLGLYQKSEIQITPGFGVAQGDGTLLNTTTAAGPLSQTANNFNFSGGAVFSSRRSRLGYGAGDSNWKGGAFALGFTRIADFNGGSNYLGTVGDNTSLLQRLREYRTPLTGTTNGSIQSQVPDSYYNLDGLGAGALLTRVDRGRRGQDTLLTQRRRGPITQGERIQTTGSMSQFDLAYGGSYRDKLYIGLGLGLVTSNYHTRRTFTESENDPTTPFTDLSLYDDVQTSGTGFNARLGLIYRVVDAVRIGASVQTPTWMRMTDTYSQSLTTNFSGTPAEIYTPTTGTNQYAYNITTPFRANGGVAVTIGKYGFITGDVEYVGYQQARLDSDPSNNLGDNADFSDVNADVQRSYAKAVNLRVGGEARLDIFRVRLGYARYGSPYSATTVLNQSATNLAQDYYTAGLGLRTGSFFFDVAGVYTRYNTYYSPYTLVSASAPVVQVSNDRYSGSVTAGFTF
ncbi:OmpP1/FadL family transporter [Hymenobacter bucti]|uniref:OmpP1/FadL family transporter n=1 Tax=Hymenobacter bucti TaxID=1844114 RepID=A0ABW4QP75_9BACT